MAILLNIVKTLCSIKMETRGRTINTPYSCAWFLYHSRKLSNTRRCYIRLKDFSTPGNDTVRVPAPNVQQTSRTRHKL